MRGEAVDPLEGERDACTTRLDAPRPTFAPLVEIGEGAQIVFDPNQPLPMTMVGHVTSSYRSDAVGRPIALALVEGGQDRMGEVVHIPMEDGAIAATITGCVFFDPDNSRLKIA